VNNLSEAIFLYIPSNVYFAIEQKLPFGEFLPVLVIGLKIFGIQYCYMVHIIVILFFRSSPYHLI